MKGQASADALLMTTFFTFVLFSIILITLNYEQLSYNERMRSELLHAVAYTKTCLGALRYVNEGWMNCSFTTSFSILQNSSSNKTVLFSLHNLTLSLPTVEPVHFPSNISPGFYVFNKTGGVIYVQKV
jgi:hypothetical protein